MTKEQLKEKIKNNELVYVIYKEKIYPLRLDSHFNIINDYLHDKILIDKILIDKIFSTKAQAQHYLDNSNVKRVEKLPFVTWEEFKNGKDVIFKTDKYNYLLWIDKNEIILKWEELGAYGFLRKWDLTEENFYKAYEICRKLFLGE